MVREQVEKILRRCRESTSEKYHDEYFLNKIRTLFTANHIKNYSFNVKRERSPLNSSEFFIAAEIIFDNERIYDEWAVTEEAETGKLLSQF